MDPHLWFKIMDHHCICS